MSKVDKLLNEILSDYTKCARLEQADKALNELIQAVRDEEFEKHEKCCDDPDYCKRNNLCDSCPAKGTRYCP